MVEATVLTLVEHFAGMCGNWVKVEITFFPHLLWVWRLVRWTYI